MKRFGLFVLGFTFLALVALGSGVFSLPALPAPATPTDWAFALWDVTDKMSSQPGLMVQETETVGENLLWYIKLNIPQTYRDNWSSVAPQILPKAVRGIVDSYDEFVQWLEWAGYRRVDTTQGFAETFRRYRDMIPPGHFPPFFTPPAAGGGGGSEASPGEDNPLGGGSGPSGEDVTKAAIKLLPYSPVLVILIPCFLLLRRRRFA